MESSNWDKAREKEYKGNIRNLFTAKIENALRESSNPLHVGDNLADLLENSDAEVVKLITPRAVRKWASTGTLPIWEEILRDPKMVTELREIGKSIANSMRPLAGNNFALWVAVILNKYFEQEQIPLRALTSGKIKSAISKKFVSKAGKGQVRDYKPDIDIVLIRTDVDDKVVAIISAKTTLAERVMQTISWKRILPIPTLLVTAWETFESGANRERVQELDGVYVCNSKVREFGNIKLFSKIAEDVAQFAN